MKITRVIALALIAGTMGGGAMAQSTSSARAPAEFPPSSYKGKQYVDSTGCVFIRAGIDGNVTWVPRVTRKRTVVCGFAPTFGGQQVAAAAPAAQKKAPQQITIAPEAAKPAPVAKAAKVAKKKTLRKPVKVAKAKPVVRQVPKVVRQKPVQPLPVQKPVVQAPVAVQPSPQVARVQPACSGASALSQQYINSGSRLPVRCGPQSGGVLGAGTARAAQTQGVQTQVAGAQAPRANVRRGGFFGLFQGRQAPAEVQAPATQVTVAHDPQTRVVTSHTSKQITRHTRIVPRHVAVNRANTTNVKVPRGYKSAWDDGRLNPKRAEQTLAGRDQMLLVWTSSLPRRLVNQATGKDLTASLALVYPYTDYATQERELGEVTLARRADGALVKRLVKNKPTTRATRRTLSQTPVYTARNAPEKPAAVQKPVRAKVAAPAAEVSSARYVQVGTYGDAASAQQVGKKVRRMGLPVRIGKYVSGGNTVRMVIAGPFASAGHVDRALRSVKQAGFGNAKRRN